MTNTATEMREKLTVAVTLDFPAASEILVSFPDRWELIYQLWCRDTPLYIAAMPPSQERPRRDHFYGLAAEINLELTTYRLYKLFRPWPMPSLIVGWNEATATGRVLKMGDIKIQMQPLGDAQVWFGQTIGVLWECYLNELGRKEANWLDVLAEFWGAVERDMGVGKIFTEPREPTFKEGYPEFLRRLGYAPDSDNPHWWSKVLR